MATEPSCDVSASLLAWADAGPPAIHAAERIVVFGVDAHVASLRIIVRSRQDMALDGHFYDVEFVQDAEHSRVKLSKMQLTKADGLRIVRLVADAALAASRSKAVAWLVAQAVADMKAVPSPSA